MDQQNENTKQNGAGIQTAADPNKQPQNPPATDAPNASPASSKQGQPSTQPREQGSPASQGQKQGQKPQNGNQKSGCGQPSCKPDAMTVLKQTPVPPVLCDWLVCIRKPAISMQYSIQKRHIPDLDTDGAQTPAASGNASGDSAPQEKGVNSDTMGVQGDFTIRYFDLAVGALAMVAVGCLIKTCCCLKRKLF